MGWRGKGRWNVRRALHKLEAGIQDGGSSLPVLFPGQNLSVRLVQSLEESSSEWWGTTGKYAAIVMEALRLIGLSHSTSQGKSRGQMVRLKRGKPGRNAVSVKSAATGSRLPIRERMCAQSSVYIGEKRDLWRRADVSLAWSFWPLRGEVGTAKKVGLGLWRREKECKRARKRARGLDRPIWRTSKLYSLHDKSVNQLPPTHLKQHQNTNKNEM